MTDTKIVTLQGCNVAGHVIWSRTRIGAGVSFHRAADDLAAFTEYFFAADDTVLNVIALADAAIAKARQPWPPRIR